MRVIRSGLILGAALLMGAGSMSAQSSAVQNTMAQDLESVTEKYVGLAQAMPANSYSWRPEDGVRSVGEVFTHMIGANYGLPGTLGVAGPAGAPGQAELAAMTDKDEIVRHLEASFAYLIGAIKSVPDAKLTDPLSYFGQEGTYLSFLNLLTTHAHEHLGQSIAYARTNHVKPPWSM